MMRARFVMAWCLIAALVVPVAIIGGAATLASASKTSKPTVALSSNVAGASPVTYTVGFTTSSSGSIPADGSITLVGPAGTVWPNSNSSYVLTDLTTSSGSFTSASSNSSADPGTDLYNWLNGPRGAAITIGVPNAIDAGDHLSLAISGVVNPEAGTDNLSVLTSSDETTATSASYTISAAAEVSKATVSLSSTAAGANGVTYAIGFNTSSAGAVPAGGSITLVAPAGTIWPDSHSAYVLTDSTTSSGSFTSASSTASGNPGTNIYNWIDGNRGAAVTIGVPNAINAGDVLSLVVNGVVNPPAGTDALSVSTSTDSVMSKSAKYTVTSASKVSQPSVVLSSSAALATGVGYTIGFKPSATGSLPAGGSITVIAPPGTALPSNACSYVLTDATTSSGSFSCASHVSLNMSYAATITVPNAIDAGDSLSLAVAGVTNPGAGSDILSVFTSTDVASASSSTYTLTGSAASLTSLGSTSFSATSSAAGANGVSYTFNFTPSASGTLTGGSSSVYVVAPAGTIFGTCPYNDCGPSSTYTFTDHTTSSGSASTVGGVTGNNNILSVPVPNTIEAGDSVTLTITAVTNALLGNSDLYLSTSADQNPVALSDDATTPESLKSVSMTASSTADGATGVNYTINFTASSSGAVEAGGAGVVNIEVPDGTNFGGCPYGDCGPSSTYTFTDHTNSSGSGSSGSVDGVNGLASVQLPHNIQAGDSVTLVITAVINPLVSGSFLISTSSDTVPVSVSLPTSAPQSVSGASLALGSTVAGNTGTTWTLNFATSSTGGLVAGNGTINLLANDGTSFGSAAGGDHRLHDDIRKWNDLGIFNHRQRFGGQL